ncbi:MAG TPA: hypothetical protein VLZ83_02550 [Edaphocola sp.]|nr:hypothetical protein [Edaphocola sp.]
MAGDNEGLYIFIITPLGYSYTKALVTSPARPQHAATTLLTAGSNASPATIVAAARPFV